MNPYEIIPFTAFCFYLGVIVYVTTLGWRNHLNQAFVFLAILFGGWALTDWLLWLPVSLDTIDTVLRAQVPFYALTGVATVDFIYALLNRRRDLAFWTLLVFNAVAIGIGVSTDLVVAGYERESWGYVLVPGPMHAPAATIGAMIPEAYGIFLLVRRMLTTPNPTERTQIRLYAVGVSFIIALAMLTFVFAPLLFRVPFAPLIHVAFLLFHSFNLYIIFRYQTFAIGIQNVADDLFARSQEGIVILDAADRVIQANNSAQAMLAGDFDASLEPTARALLQGYQARHDSKQATIELEVESDSGDPRSLSVSVTPITRTGQLAGNLLLVRDITRQRRSEQHILNINRDLAQARDAALSASESKSRFLANISHELRTPLNAILGYSEMAHEELTARQEQPLATDIDHIHTAGTHLLALIDNILDLSKIEAGKLDLHIDNFTVSGLCQLVGEMVTPMMKHNGNRFELDCPDDIGNMRSDATKVRQSLLNILGNAARFTREGEVSMRVRRETNAGADMIRFSVTDSGIGIEPERMERIFDAFTQADNSTTRVYGGTGLGLTISRHLCRMLGGDISAQSAPGQGSTFTVSVPAEFRGSLTD